MNDRPSIRPSDSTPSIRPSRPTHKPGQGPKPNKRRERRGARSEEANDQPLPPSSGDEPRGGNINIHA